MFRLYSKCGVDNRVTVLGSHSSGMLSISAACCSTDDNFSRKEGRDLAETRMIEGKLYTRIPIPQCDLKTFIHIAKGVEHSIQKSKRPISKLFETGWVSP